MDGINFDSDSSVREGRRRRSIWPVGCASGGNPLFYRCIPSHLLIFFHHHHLLLLLPPFLVFSLANFNLPFQPLEVGPEEDVLFFTPDVTPSNKETSRLVNSNSDSINSSRSYRTPSDNSGAPSGGSRGFNFQIGAMNPIARPLFSTPGVPLRDEASPLSPSPPPSSPLPLPRIASYKFSGERDEGKEEKKEDEGKEKKEDMKGKEEKKRKQWWSAAYAYIFYFFSLLSSIFNSLLVFLIGFALFYESEEASDSRFTCAKGSNGTYVCRNFENGGNEGPARQRQLFSPLGTPLVIVFDISFQFFR